MGERYRREMLAHGGAKEPMQMVEGNESLVSYQHRVSSYTCVTIKYCFESSIPLNHHCSIVIQDSNHPEKFDEALFFFKLIFKWFGFHQI